MLALEVIPCIRYEFPKLHLTDAVDAEPGSAAAGHGAHPAEQPDRVGHAPRAGNALDQEVGILATEGLRRVVNVVGCAHDSTLASSRAPGTTAAATGAAITKG